MPAALQVFNDSGTVQIDETYRNYGFRQIVPVFISASAGAPTGYQLIVPGEAALVACKASTLLPIALHSYFDGTYWTYNWRFNPPFITGTYSETVEFYVFDVPSGSGYSNVGLEVYDAAGKRVFHSDMDPMKVRSVQGCDMPYTGAAGRSYVPLIVRNPIRTEFVAGMGYRHSTRALRVSGSNIITQNVDIGSAGLGEFYNVGLYAAVEVTGLA